MLISIDERVIWNAPVTRNDLQVTASAASKLFQGICAQTG